MRLTPAAAAVLSASALVVAGAAGLFAQRRTPAQSRTPVAGYRVVNAYPHDPDAYTQGLIYRDGVLFESTGRNGQSTLRKVKLETGEVLQQRPRRRRALRRRAGRVEGPPVPAHLAVERRVRLRPRHVRAGQDAQVSGRRVGPHRGPGRTDSQRWHGAAPRPRSRDVPRDPPGDGARWRRAGRSAQRARVRARRGVGQRLAHQPHRPHRTRRPAASSAGST